MAVVHIERIHERRRAMRVEDSGRAYLTERRPASPVPGMHEVLAPLFGDLLNLSETGVLIELDEAVQPGRRVVLGLELGGQRLEVPATVARICRPRGGGTGRVHVGLRFGDLSAGEREAIARAVDAGKFTPHFN